MCGPSHPAAIDMVVYRSMNEGSEGASLIVLFNMPKKTAQILTIQFQVRVTAVLSFLKLYQNDFNFESNLLLLIGRLSLTR